jgi:hypothetical protein
MRKRPFLDDAGHTLILATFCLVFVTALFSVPF